MLGMGIIIPFLPKYAEEMGATGVQVGLIFSGFSLTRFFFLPLVGKVSGKIGKKPLLLTGLFGYALISLGYIWADSFSELVFIRLLNGAIAAVVLPTSLAYIGEIAPKNKEGTVMGRFNMSIFMGFGIGPFMGGQLHKHFGYNMTFFVMGILTLFAFMCVLIFLPWKEGHDEAKKNLSGKVSFREAFSSRVIIGIFIFRAINQFGRGATMAFIPILATTYFKISMEKVGIIISLQVLSVTFFQPFFGKLADRYNRLYMILFGSTCFSVFLFALPHGMNFWGLLVLNLLMGVTASVSMPASAAMVVEEGRKYGMVSVMAILQMAMSFGNIFGPVICGQIYDLAGINYTFYFAATVGLIGTAFFYYYLKDYDFSLVDETVDTSASAGK